jgi:hypothetical protein
MIRRKLIKRANVALAANEITSGVQLLLNELM